MNVEKWPISQNSIFGILESFAGNEEIFHETRYYAVEGKLTIKSYMQKIIRLRAYFTFLSVTMVTPHILHCDVTVAV